MNATKLAFKLILLISGVGYTWVFLAKAVVSLEFEYVIFFGATAVCCLIVAIDISEKISK